VRQRLTEFSQCSASAAKGAIVHLRREELAIIVRSLGELANGLSIPEWEFPTLVGNTRAEVRELLASLHRLLVHYGKDLTALREKENTVT
jgi:hypothetical protein